jgi:hypothetical protein
MASQRLRTFEVNLSDPTPLPGPVAGVPDVPYRVSHLDPERFILHPMLRTPEDVTWRVEVHWLCNGQSGVLVADLAGGPFRLVGPPRSSFPTLSAAQRRAGAEGKRTAGGQAGNT